MWFLDVLGSNTILRHQGQRDRVRMDRPRHKRITHASALKLNYLQALNFQSEPSHMRGDGCEPKPMRSIPSCTAISRFVSPSEGNNTKLRLLQQGAVGPRAKRQKRGTVQSQLHARARFRELDFVSTCRVSSKPPHWRVPRHVVKGRSPQLAGVTLMIKASHSCVSRAVLPGTFFITHRKIWDLPVAQCIVLRLSQITRSPGCQRHLATNSGPPRQIWLPKPTTT